MNDYPSPIRPFRWNIAQRSELGGLLEFRVPIEIKQFRRKPIPLEPGFTPVSEWTLKWLEDSLVDCGARMIAYSRDSDFCFVGRSPESIYDYLGALLADTSWAGRLTLLHFSMYGFSEAEIVARYSGAVPQFRRYLASLGLAPPDLATRPRPVALVDVVVSGGTLGNLVGILYNWCLQSGYDWGAVRRKILIVGLTERTKTSPKTRRWQQHAAWLNRLPAAAVKNVSIDDHLFEYLGGMQPKVTAQFYPGRWTDERVIAPEYDRERLAALKMANWLHERGKQKSSRLEFARALSRQPAMREPWFRALAQELSR